MKRHKVDSQRERRILIALIVSKSFLAQASKVLDLNLINTDHFRVVAEWCLSYYKEYKKAPGTHIEDIYHKWSEDNQNATLVDSVKDFLETLGDQYDKEGEINIPYLLDELANFLSKRKMNALKETIEYALTRGDAKEAEQAVTSYRRVEVGQGAGFDPMLDRDAWRRAFAAPAKPLIHFKGDAGRFFNRALTRDALVGIQASEKQGKTWWCVEFAMRALMERRRVALFEVGDLSESQIMLRLGMRWSRKPLWRGQCGEIPVPREIEFDEAEESGYKIKNDIRVVRSPTKRAYVMQAIRQFRIACGMSKTASYIRTSIHPTGSITVQGISAILDQWAQDHNWVADVVIVDYADILAPEDTKNKEFRHQSNDTWKALRRLSQERHALVIVPTQANAMSYNQEPEKLQTMRNYSEDKRKYAHVTAMMALNQTHEEKEMGGMRVNWLVMRESPFSMFKPLYVGTCFALGKAVCCASLPE